MDVLSLWTNKDLELTMEPDEEDLEAEECTGNPYECPCDNCRAWLIDIGADRAYDERKDAA